MINTVVLVGRLTKDPVQKMTAQGKPVVAFTVAVNVNRDTAEYISCRAYGKTAELLASYCKKGSQIGLNGSVHAYTTDRNGQKEYHQEVLVNSIEFLSPKQEKAAQIVEEPVEFEVNSDDLPF